MANDCNQENWKINSNIEVIYIYERGVIYVIPVE